ncbi:MAG: SirB2 family protein [Halioglobus sp.]|nr:SirB2 family protein [Halioglobus sp.]
MTLAVFLKLIHVTCAFLSIAGFSLRGYWMIRDNPLLQHRVVRRLPHLVDTLLLLSALMLLVVWGLSPLETPWLVAKLIALLVYIALGMVALRFGRSKGIRVGAWLLALVTAGYIVSVAYSKNPLGFIQLI